MRVKCCWFCPPPQPLWKNFYGSPCWGYLVYVLCRLVYCCPVFAVICWERVDTTDSTAGQLSGGPGSTDPPNYYYFSHADGDREACQLACEQEARCHAYVMYLPLSQNAAYGDTCYGVSKSLTRIQETSAANSGYMVDCGSQMSKMLASNWEYIRLYCLQLCMHDVDDKQTYYTSIHVHRQL